ncbi:MAG: hypothetical protein H0X71_10310 [Rubrobacter sp.]|nr:hypothetical protein [Rubrobacter sp.]
MPELDFLVMALQNTPGGPGWAPLRLIAGFLLIVTIASGAYLFTYWISKDE